MTLNFWFHYSLDKEQKYTFTVASKLLFDHYKETYPEIDWTLTPEFLNNQQYRDAYGYIPSAHDIKDIDRRLAKFVYNQPNYQTTIIENPDNGKYILICYWDKASKYVSKLPDVENMVQFLPAVGVHDNDFNYKDFGIPYTPISKCTFFLSNDSSIDKHKDNPKRTVLSKPYYRGCSYGMKRWTSMYDSRFDMRCEGILPEEFVEEMSQSAINVDFNCVAEPSDRTNIAMGLGTALIRPKLTIQYKNQLIPDYHYAEVKYDLNNIRGEDSYKHLAEAYLDRYEDVKKDRDFMVFLSENGRKYYEQNDTLESHIQILKDTINLDLLK